MSALNPPWTAEVVLGELLDAVAVPAWLHAEGLVLRANPAMQRLCGLDAAGLAASTHLQMVVPDDRAALATATTECLHGSGEPPAQTAELLTANGSHRPVELTLRRIGWGSRQAALVTCVDLSDFQHVQNMLLGMSSLLRQIVDGAPVATFVIDREHRVTHWNSACERLTGRSADEMLGSSESWRAFHAEPHALLCDLIVDGLDPVVELAGQGDPVRSSALALGACEHEAYYLHQPDSPLAAKASEDGRWIHMTAAPFRDASGKVMGAIVTLQDVSERRRTEEDLTRRLDALVTERSAELAAHAQLMDAFIDNAPFGVVYTVNDRVQRANRRMAEIFGGSPADDAPSHLAPDDERALHDLARPLFARDEPLHHELALKHRNGKRLWVQVNAFPVEYSDTTTGAWWMLQDRSEVRAAQQALAQRVEELKTTNRKLEQAQNQLLQADKMASIGQLAAGVAHEINNPVGFVSSNLHTLRQYVEALLKLVDAQQAVCAQPGDAEAAQRLSRVQREVELGYLKEDLPQLLDESADGLSRVKKIVQDLKDFSRVDQADWQQADLNAGLESTLNVVRNEIKYKAEVVKNLGQLPLVTCLAGQLNQVFLNLIVNASQAIREHGTITLSSGHVPAAAAGAGDWVWVQVDDTGCGMTEAVRRRIFEPFFTTKDVGKGTGLGLSLSFSIVQRHGGAIQVRSQPGVGSAFRVWVPVGGPTAVGDKPGAPPAWS